MVKGGLAKWKERNIRIYIDEHLFVPIYLVELYALCGLSHGHFHKAFKATFSATPIEYIHRRRIEEACQRLEDTDEPLAQMARVLGYSDQPQFGKRFKKVTGVTPKQWRMEYGHLVQQNL